MAKHRAPRPMAKHRAPRYVRTRQVLAGVPVAAGATVVGIGVLNSPAQAAGAHDWTGVAQCSSGGDWTVNTGNGYYGGLAFLQSTWVAFGGTEFAPRADLATPEEQVTVAERVLDGQGIRAWPSCGRHLQQGTSTTGSSGDRPPAATQDDDAETYGRHASPVITYTVERGDTLRTIAAAYGETPRALFERNVGVIGSNPDLILPGQLLITSDAAQGDAAAATTPAEAAAAAKPAPSPEPAPAPEAAPAPEGSPAREASPVEQRAEEAPRASRDERTPAAAPAPAAPATPRSGAVARISNTAGDVTSATRAAAERVVSSVPGANGITIGGTRASAADPHGHPSGRALDYMVMRHAGLGDAITQFHIAHWDDLGVDYIIWEQRILSSPNGSWEYMSDRGSATANHYDHVHVNYR